MEKINKSKLPFMITPISEKTDIKTYYINTFGPRTIKWCICGGWSITTVESTFKRYTCPKSSKKKISILLSLSHSSG